jgi:hypothetical protein
VLGVVAQPADVLAPAEVAEAEPRLPRHRDHAAVDRHPGQLGHRQVGGGQVLEDLDAGDQVGDRVGQRQHPGVGHGDLDPGQLAGHQRLVVAVLDAQNQVGAPLSRQQALQAQALADADVDQRPRQRAHDGPHAAGPAVEEAAHDRVGRAVLGRVLAGGPFGRARGQADRAGARRGRGRGVGGAHRKSVSSRASLSPGRRRR